MFRLGFNNSSSVTCNVDVDTDASAVDVDVEVDAFAVDPVAGGKFCVGIAVRTKNMFEDLSFAVKC